MSTPKPKTSQSPLCVSAESTPKSSQSQSPNGEKKMLMPVKKLLPRRPGITWVIGSKLEAMDYMEKWYPAKIVEIDDDEQKVLIHFDGWNSRFDEWVHMRSEKVRALVPSHVSDRSAKDKNVCSYEFNSGDQVLAKWTDGCIYPGELCSLLDDGMAEVRFFDGHLRLVKLSKLLPVPEQLKSEVISIKEFLGANTKIDEGAGGEGSKVSRREALLAKRAEKEARESVEVKLKALAEKATRLLKDETSGAAPAATSATASTISVASSPVQSAASHATAPIPPKRCTSNDRGATDSATATVTGSHGGRLPLANCEISAGRAAPGGDGARPSKTHRSSVTMPSSKKKQLGQPVKLPTEKVLCSSDDGVSAVPESRTDSEGAPPAESVGMSVATTLADVPHGSAAQPSCVGNGTQPSAAAPSSGIEPTAIEASVSSVPSSESTKDEGDLVGTSSDVTGRKLEPGLSQQSTMQAKNATARKTGGTSFRERVHRGGTRLLVAGIFKARISPSKSPMRSRSSSTTSATGSQLRSAKRRRSSSGRDRSSSTSVRQRHGRDRSNRGRGRGDNDSGDETALFAAIAAATSSSVSGRKRKCTLRPDLALAVAQQALESPEDLEEEKADEAAAQLASIGDVANVPSITEGTVKDGPGRKSKARSSASRAAEKKRRRERERERAAARRALKRRRLEAQQRNSADASSMENVATHRCGYITSAGPAVATKAFKIEEDHNHFKCIYEGCDKSFRKASLLDYHVKYYHLTNEPDETSMATTPAATRRISGSRDIAHSDSDVSAREDRSSLAADACRHVDLKRSPAARRSSTRARDARRLRSSRAKSRSNGSSHGSTSTRLPRHVPSLPEQPSHDGGGDDHSNMQASDLDDMLVEDDAVFSDSSQDVPSKPTCEGPYSQELINCICGFSEEDGLMIQCDTCLRWQHAACFSMTKETLPSKYVCFLCHDSPGMKTSCECVDNYEFFTEGKLPNFPLVKTSIPCSEMGSTVATLKSSHELASKILRLQTIMTSVRKEICVLRTNDKQELCRWRLSGLARCRGSGDGSSSSRAMGLLSTTHGRSTGIARSDGLLGTKRDAGLPALSSLQHSGTVSSAGGGKSTWPSKVSSGRITERRRSSASRGGPPGGAQAGRLSSTELGLCRAALLEVVHLAQDGAEQQLDSLEQQIVELEKAAGLHCEPDNSEQDLNLVKKKLSSLISDVEKVAHIARLSG